ncbi:MAG: AAA family ATPase [Cyanobacteria bacterium P01_G01_bin.19]
MTKFIQTTKIFNWLETKLINRQCGIICESPSQRSFDAIQNFIESHEQPFKTLVTYYEAFPQENALEFCSTLAKELESKLGNFSTDSKRPLAEVIQDAGLKTIVIDNCYLCPQDTLDKLLHFFSDCQVSIILVGEREKMISANILDHSVISKWDILEFNTTLQI